MTDALPAPPYGSGTLADVLPSVAHLLGVSGYPDALDLAASDDSESAPGAVTVLLVDGLGWWPWQDAIDSTPTLASMMRRRLSTSVPSTTPTALASLGTGLPPGAHGIVGAAFRLPEDDSLLHPLSWTDGPHPLATQPEPTVFERVASAGVPVVRIGARAYAESGLTRAVLRGGSYVGSDSVDEIIEAIAGHRTGLAYAYLPDLDRTGHVHGVDSAEWREGLVAVEHMVTRIIERLSEDHLLVVTADHGMVDCPVTARISVEALPSAERVVAIAGEPRLRHVYCQPDSLDLLQRSWQEDVAERAVVLTREEFLSQGLLGPTDPDYAGRVGDLVIVARGDTVLVSDVDPIVSGLVGQHGSVTEAEMDIPLLLARGSGHG